MVVHGTVDYHLVHPCKLFSQLIQKWDAGHFQLRNREAGPANTNSQIVYSG